MNEITVLYECIISEASSVYTMYHYTKDIIVNVGMGHFLLSKDIAVVNLPNRELRRYLQPTTPWMYEPAVDTAATS